MDGLGLSAVVTTGALGFAGLAMNMWSTKQAARVTRQGRVDERRIDACVEVLRLVEHKTFWFERRVARAEFVGDPYEQPPPLPASPEIGDQVVVETLLVAFGSPQLREACIGWTSAVAEMDSQLEVAAWNFEQDYHGPETSTSATDLAELAEKLNALIAERRTVELAIAEEIGRIQGST